MSKDEYRDELKRRDVQCIPEEVRPEIAKELSYEALVKVIEFTTEAAASDFVVTRRIDVIGVSSVLGMNFIRDWFARWRDLFGGKSRSSQNVLDSAFNKAKRALLEKAFTLGANGLIAVRFDFEEMSAKNNSMLKVSGYGTAVIIRRLNQENSLK